jgi:DNA-binding NtrC family response regulator
VEDEDELRIALKRLLSGSGYRVLDAGDPEQAVRLAADCVGSIDLLLTDVVMPVMNGVDLADAICAERPETRVLMMSGHMDLRAPLARALPPGVGFVPKPFASGDLLEKIREVLDAPGPVRS